MIRQVCPRSSQSKRPPSRQLGDQHRSTPTITLSLRGLTGIREVESFFKPTGFLSRCAARWPPSTLSRRDDPNGAVSLVAGIRMGMRLTPLGTRRSRHVRIPRMRSVATMKKLGNT